MFGLNQEEKDKLNDIHVKIGSIEYNIVNIIKEVQEKIMVYINIRLNDLEKNLKEIKEKLENEKCKKEKSARKKQDGQRASKGGYEDVPKRKRGRQAVVKKAKEVK